MYERDYSFDLRDDGLMDLRTLFYAYVSRQGKAGRKEHAYRQALRFALHFLGVETLQLSDLNDFKFFIFIFGVLFYDGEEKSRNNGTIWRIRHITL